MQCGRCGGISCADNDGDHHDQCKYLSCMKSLGSKCSDCECNRNIAKTNLCDGVLCNGDYECKSNRCYLGFCAKDAHTTETCTQDEDAGCGKCDRVPCFANRQCQNYSCDSAQCYDTRYWFLLLIGTLVSVLILVAAISIIVVRSRNKQRRLAAERRSHRASQNKIQ